MYGFILTSLFAAASTLIQADQVTVEAYVSGITPQISYHVVLGAEHKASLVLQQAGVNVEWRRGRPTNCEPEGSHRIQIEFLPTAPDSVTESALAATYQSQCPSFVIRVFLDRLKHVIPAHPLTDRALLGNVLAHEIIHTCQGKWSHDESGLMKAMWDSEDIQEMTR